jgi:hypothetical protein
MKSGLLQVDNMYTHAWKSGHALKLTYGAIQRDPAKEHQPIQLFKSTMAVHGKSGVLVATELCNISSTSKCTLARLVHPPTSLVSDLLWNNKREKTKTAADDQKYIDRDAMVRVIQRNTG